MLIKKGFIMRFILFTFYMILLNHGICLAFNFKDYFMVKVDQSKKGNSFLEQESNLFFAMESFSWEEEFRDSSGVRKLEGPLQGSLSLSLREGEVKGLVKWGNQNSFELIVKEPLFPISQWQALPPQLLRQHMKIGLLEALLTHWNTTLSLDVRQEGSYIPVSLDILRAFDVKGYDPYSLSKPEGLSTTELKLMKKLIQKDMDLIPETLQEKGLYVALLRSRVKNIIKQYDLFMMNLESASLPQSPSLSSFLNSQLTYLRYLFLDSTSPFEDKTIEAVKQSLRNPNEGSSLHWYSLEELYHFIGRHINGASKDLLNEDSSTWTDLSFALKKLIDKAKVSQDPYDFMLALNLCLLIKDSNDYKVITTQTTSFEKTMFLKKLLNMVLILAPLFKEKGFEAQVGYLKEMVEEDYPQGSEERELFESIIEHLGQKGLLESLFPLVLKELEEVYNPIKDVCDYFLVYRTLHTFKESRRYHLTGTLDLTLSSDVLEKGVTEQNPRGLYSIEKLSLLIEQFKEYLSKQKDNYPNENFPQRKLDYFIRELDKAFMAFKAKAPYTLNTLSFSHFSKETQELSFCIHRVRVAAQDFRRNVEITSNSRLDFL
jgi:hypothetical protein